MSACVLLVFARKKLFLSVSVSGMFCWGLVEFCSIYIINSECGLQVIVSGKLRAARAKSMKFKDGYMISSGSPVNDYIDSAVRHVMLRQVRTSTVNL